MTRKWTVRPLIMAVFCSYPSFVICFETVLIFGASPITILFVWRYLILYGWNLWIEEIYPFIIFTYVKDHAIDGRRSHLHVLLGCVYPFSPILYTGFDLLVVICYKKRNIDIISWNNALFQTFIGVSKKWHKLFYYINSNNINHYLNGS